VLALGHVERFNPVFDALREFITRPLFIEAHRLAPFVPRSMDVDVVLDLMIHDLDLTLAVIDPGTAVERVDASGVPVVTPREDITNARIAFGDGRVANLTASRVSQERMRRIRYFSADRAYIALDLLRRTGEVMRLAGDPTEWLARGETPPMSELLERRSVGPFPDVNPLADELGDFLAAIDGTAAPRVSGADGRRALDLALIIHGRVTEQLRKVQAAPR